MAYGDGNLNVHVKTRAKDEVGELVFNFNIFLEKLRGIINKLKDANVDLDDAGDSLTIMGYAYARGKGKPAAKFIVKQKASE